MLLESQEFLLKGPSSDLLGFTPSEFQCCGSSSKGAREIWGVTGLSGIRARVGGVAFSQTEMLTGTMVPLLGPLPTELAGRHHS